ncbi:MAG: hypothetical protein DWI59_05490 [Chloroflexi bacterium]|nr:MAG: hypothetical protein DWI59_05490 [Chloroflexota bacterium]
MPTVAAFHQVNEAEKPGPKRMHHTNDACAEGIKIARSERVEGTGGFRRCVDCSRQDEIDALRSAAASGTR